MAEYHDYYFNNLSRIGNDVTTNTQRNQMNNRHADYSVNNLYNQKCNINNDLLKATSQPNIFFKGSTQVGPDGCNVDALSDLLIGKGHECTKDRTMLQQRTFLTVPYLGRGSCNVIMEQKVRMGDASKELKSDNQLNEQPSFDINNYPLDHRIKKQVSDSKHTIESDAAEGWVRGGMNTRDFYRSSSYSMDANEKKRESIW